MLHPRHITILSTGSRGDVQPFLALARGLRHVGHTVRLAAPPNFQALAMDYGVEFWPIGPDWQAFLDQDRFKAIVESGNLLRGLKDMAREASGMMDLLLADAWRACQGTEAIIATIIGPIGHAITEKLGVPYIEAVMQPSTPTRVFPAVIFPPTLHLGGALNWQTHQVWEQFFWQLYRRNINAFRTGTLGLAPYPLSGPMRQIRRQQVLRLEAYSPLVVPRPLDWPIFVVITGYWFLPAPPMWQAPQELAAFLDAGPPPVYVGFGSMVTRDVRQIVTLVLEALARAGLRGILARGWGGLHAQEPASDQVLWLDSAPHDWLFPRMAAVVHHGGAGTTAAGLRSGVPSIVVPHAFDQPFWGQQVAALGAGPPPIPRRQLTAQRLAHALTTAVHDQTMRQRAAAVGAHIRGEQGVAWAIDHIHRVIGSG